MRAIASILALVVAASLVAPAGAADILTYATEDGAVRSVPVVVVTKDDVDEFRGRVVLGGKARRLRIPGRLVISLRRGDSDDENQWSKQLASGKRLMSAGQLETKGTVPGAEEIFTKVAYSTEKGTPGQEKTEQIAPWHNMYAVYYLIECRLRIGTPAKLELALKNVEEFEKRSDGKYGKLITWEVPAQEGTVVKSKVYCWGDNRLSQEVRLFQADVLAALKRADEARKAYSSFIDDLKKKKGSPVLLTAAVERLAELNAEGQDSEKQEDVFRAAGSSLGSVARTQPDDFGKQTLRLSANRLLLRGADLLLESARAGKLSFDLPLGRYQGLKSGEGRQDPALYVGAQAGIGICLTEKGEGQRAYEALLEVVTKGQDFPDQMSRALYYLAKAAPLYAQEVQRGGGRGDFLRAEAERWLQDLRDRYPSSEWAEKVADK
jgi:hypothetical protein